MSQGVLIIIFAYGFQARQGGGSSGNLIPGYPPPGLSGSASFMEDREQQPLDLSAKSATTKSVLTSTALAALHNHHLQVAAAAVVGAPPGGILSRVLGGAQMPKSADDIVSRVLEQKPAAR